MLSTRCLALLALVATAAALPALDKPAPQPITRIDQINDEIASPVPGPWFNIPLIGDISKIFAPLWKLFPSFEDLGPRILADDDKFQVIVQVKDYKKNDLKVKTKGDFIFVQGSHEATVQEDHDLFASQFFHTYTLPTNASSTSVTAELSTDGFLIITAPISGPVDRSKETDREVPIVSTGAPYNKEETPEVAPVAPEKPAPEVAPTAAEEPAPELVSDEDRKEPTTIPPQSEDATFKDNVIPHGSEANEVSP